MKEPTVETNPATLRYYILCREGMFILPIMVAYFGEKGISLAEFLSIMAIFNVALLIFEIPSGYISDRYGRRLSMIAASIIMLLGYIWLWLSSGFWNVLGAEILTAVGLSLFSGTASALMYDSLLAEGKEGSFAGEEGRVKAWGAYSIGLAGLFGGFLYSVNIELPIILTCIVWALAIGFAFRLVEPPVHKPQAEKHPIKEMQEFVHYALRGHDEIPWLILYSSVLNSATFLGFWLMQPYWEAAEFPYWMFGVLFLILQLGRGWCHGNASRVINWLGHGKLVVLLWLSMVIAFALQGAFIHPYAVISTFIPALVFGIGNVMILEMINERVESRMRATIISVDSMAWRLMYVLITPIAMYLIENYSLSTTFLAASALWFLIGIIPIIMLFKKEIL